MASSSEPTTGGGHFEHLLGIKTLGDKPCKPSSGCVMRKLQSSAPSFSSLSTSSSSSLSCSSLSCSCSCSSLSSLGSDLGVNGAKKEEEDIIRDPIGYDQEDEEDEEEEEEEGCWGYYGPRDGRRRFPPPIRMLAKLENSPCHIPRLLKRSYEDGGRLVIRELKVRHHEFFRAHRENGRLTLKLIHIDDVDDVDHNMLNHRQDQEEQEEGGEEEEEEDEEKEEEPDPMNHDGLDDDQESLPEIAPLPTSLPSRSLPLSPLFSGEDCVKKTQDLDINARCKKTSMVEQKPDVRPWAAKLSMEMLSSSMPESTTSGVARNVCFSNERPRSFFHMPVPMVHLVPS